MTASDDLLRRYTDLASLLDMLSRKAVTLLPPSTWDDRNDRLLMDTYKKRRQLQTLLALCLTSRAETYHHWRIFTSSSSGVCVQFNRSKFARVMRSAGLKVKEMTYLKLGQLDAEEYGVDDLPFLKRLGFEDEGEHRVVYESKTREDELKKVSIDLGIIENIVLNPWMPASVFESTKTVIEGLCQGAGIRVSHSSLIDSKRWRSFASRFDGEDEV